MSETDKMEVDLDDEGHDLEDDPDHDPVVKAVDVFLARDLETSIQLVQFPLRPTWRPYDGELLTKTMIKPGQEKLHIEYAISPQTKLREKLDDDPDAVDYSSSKFVLTSAAVPLKTNYGIAYFKDGQLHITPLPDSHSVLQMRPSFSYIDEADTIKKEEKLRNAAEEDEVDEDEEDDEMDTNQRIQVRFKRKETDRALARRQQSHTFLKEQEMNEEWTDLTYYSSEAPETESMREKLRTHDENLPLEFRMNRTDYLEMLNPAPEEAWDAGTGPSGVATPDVILADGTLSLAKLKKLPLPGRVEAIMRSAFVLRFSRVCQIAMGDGVTRSKEKEVLECLERVAVLVQGCWVVKGRLAYDTPSDVDAFDGLLHLLTLRRSVNRNEFTGKYKVMPEIAYEMLSHVAICRPSRVWEFKLPVDGSFLDRYPDVANRYQEYWRDMDRRHDVESAQTASVGAPERFLGGSAQVRRRGESSSSSSTTTTTSSLSAVKADDVRAVLMDLFLLHGVCNVDFLLNRVNGRASGSGHLGLDMSWWENVTKAQIEGVLNGLARCVHGAYLLETLSHPTPHFDKCRDVAIQTFADKSDGRLKKADITKAIEAELSMNIPQGLYSKIMKELAQAAGGGWWQFKSGDGGTSPSSTST
eukprot:TRINITY_DN14696_c0_g1_i1.p1 TRINITY_DN14696_c0_g1~~TRINITY_DN14696_c0_g1_i1.p1  ORF type:complete len:641 (+),score=155.51 TRINITY_DN14696_c0_g1_i1:303-2225(+)